MKKDGNPYPDIEYKSFTNWHNDSQEESALFKQNMLEVNEYIAELKKVLSALWNLF